MRRDASGERVRVTRRRVARLPASSTTLGNAASSLDPSCRLDQVELELLDSGGQVMGTPGLTTAHELVRWFMFIPVHFDIHAATIAAPSPVPGSSPQDLSGSFSYDYALGRTLDIRWRYYFTGGSTCTP